MKYRIAIVIVAVMLVTFGVGFGLGFGINAYSKSNAKYDYPEFDDCRVGVRLTKEASFKFLDRSLDYSAEDFDEVCAVEVRFGRPEVTEWARRTYLGIPTEQYEDFALEDLDDFRQDLILVLPQHDKGKVMEALDILMLRDDVELVGYLY